MKTKFFFTLTAINLVCLVTYYAVGQYNEIERLKFLIKTFDVEKSLTEATIQDLRISLQQATSDAYHKGYNEGELKTGIAFMEGKSMHSYSDGYHAAISQFGPVDASKLPNVDALAVYTLTELFYECIEEKNYKEASEVKDLIRAELNSRIANNPDGPVFVDGTIIEATDESSD